MYATRRYKLVGLLYLAPALLFVAVFTFYPFIQMVLVSFNSWSLITPPKYIGIDNYTRAFSDKQFWVSLTYSLQYTILITPILMVGGYVIALLVAGNSRPAAPDPHDRVRARGHRPRRVQPALVLAVQPDVRADQHRAAWTWA